MIPDRLQTLLEPQERFETLQAQASRLGSRVSDLGYANFSGPLDADVRDVLQQALATQRELAFQYTPYGGARLARRAVADVLSASHGDGFTWRDVVLTTGAASALTVALQAIGKPGDEVVVPVPCWFDHPLYVAASGKTVVGVPLPEHSGFDLDLDALGRALTPRTVAVILSNPANPTGRTHGESMASQLAAVLTDAERRLGITITLVADETHRDLAGPKFTSAATLYPRTLIVYSFGKYHSLQGQRLGYVAVPPAHPERSSLATELARWIRIVGNVTPTSLMQLALPGLLAIRHDATDLDRWRARYVAALEAAGYQPIRPDGTHFIYVRTPGGLSDDKWAEALLTEHQVLVAPAPLFHHTGYFRVSLTAGPESLERGLGALEAAGAQWC